jgi:choline-sulfatase
MTHRDTHQPPKSDDTMKITRRRFLRGGLAAAAAVVGSASLAFPPGSEAAAPPPGARDEKTGSIRGKGPNFLIILCDEMRFPPVYESDALKRFRRRYLKTQNLLRANGLEFERHYVASSACVPSRASILTGHYPSLHGATQTAGGGAKEAWDGDVFWLDPNSVPTFGNYFRAAGYRTYWRGKWHVSNADLIVPGTRTQLVSYDPDTGVPDPAKEALYSAAHRLDPYGFSGWIGPDAGCDAKSPLNSGSSVPEPQRGRDLSIAEEGVNLIQELELDHDHSSAPWLVVCSFVNPHDIALVGEKTMTDPKWAFPVENCVPSGDPNDWNFLFIWDQFQQTLNDDLSTKPQVQASYQAGYSTFVGEIDPNFYWQYYYQLHKNVDQEMGKVMAALLASRFKNDTIVVLTSDHGDMLGAHNYLYQKFYEAYDETVRVPLIIWNKHLFKDPRSIDALTSHVDLAPTLLGLAGIDPEPIRQQLARDHSDARPFVGRDLSPITLGDVDPASVNDPVYFMTDDNPTRGLHQSLPDGTTNPSVVQPSHIETVVARLNDGKLWKYSRYFDSPQFWSSPGTPGDDEVEDVVLEQVQKTPPPEIEDDPIGCTITVKATPKPDEFELYNVTDDPMELDNKYNKPGYSSQQAALAELLEEQCAQKRLTPCSGDVLGQPLCGQQSCSK